MANEIMMDFPETWEEYEQQYGFEDTDEVYTNGSRLIQSFRVKQWLDHLSVPKSTDLISREAVIDLLNQFGYYDKEMERDLSAIPSAVPEREKGTQEISIVVREKGEWIEKEGYDGDTYYDCSACGNSWTTIEGTPWDNGMDFCPNCGADMRGKDNDPI